MDGAAEGYEPYEDRIAEQPPTPIEDESEGLDMLYSSGTTGRPKGIRLPLPEVPVGSPTPVLALSQALYGFGEDSVYLSPAPLYHSAPLRFTMAVHRLGATVVVMEHFDPLEFLRLIERHRVTHTQVVPTMFVRLLKLDPAERERYDLSSLKACVHAAAPCPVPIKEQMIEWWGPIIHEYYAGTEGNGFTAINSEDWLDHKGSVGRALVGEIHIVGEDGSERGPGEPGTIYFGGGAEFEYHNDPEKTASSRDDRGWSTLGDVGYLDDDGYLYLTDRKAYMIISGGVNIYPQEAENVLTMHPKVADVAVIGVPNEEFGEEVKAIVQPMDMADAGPTLERELIDFCRQHLAGLKCPRSVDFEEELPRAPTGKLYKRLLRDRYWEGHATRIL
jgi:long-chain acyl-CoA synthetase